MHLGTSLIHHRELNQLLLRVHSATAPCFVASRVPVLTPMLLCLPFVGRNPPYGSVQPNGCGRLSISRCPAHCDALLLLIYERRKPYKLQPRVENSAIQKHSFATFTQEQGVGIC